MSDVQEYPDVVQEIRGALNPGRLKLQRNSIIFKNVKTGKVDQFQSSDVDKAQWLKRARGFCLKFILTSGVIHRYDGFKDGEFEKLAKFISSYYSVSLEKIDLSLKGWNWGSADFEGNSLNFKIENVLAFEIPLTNVMNATTSKNEVAIEFHQNDDSAVSLMEVRFHIPPVADTEIDPVVEFHKNVMENASIIQISGESICTLSEVQCLTPRGRYDLKLFPGFLQLHGKTFDYKIPYQTILRLFLLPHKDGRQMYFVVSLDPPIKQGQTRYHFLILLFNKEDVLQLDLNLSEEDIKSKYEDKLQKEMNGLEFEVVSKVFKAITGRKITVPGSFMGHSGAQAVSCSYKAATGLLYPLERGFIFVHKPPLHIRFDEVANVNFARSAGSTRSFDFEVDTNAGATFTFVGVEKDEYGKLYDFVKSKNLRVKNIGDKGSKNPSYNEMSDSDAEGADHDAYLERMKAEGKDRDDDDSDDSSDESFNPGESGSEVAEEYDSNPPTTSDSDSDSDYSGGSSDGQAVGSDAEERRRVREEKKKEKEQKKKEKEERKKEQKKEQKKEPKTKTVKEGSTRKRKSTKGKDKDPNRPKRPQSAYFIWLNEHREQIKEENPGISITDLSKKAGEMWKEVTDKTEWDEKAKEAKAEYQKAMEEYNKNKPSDSEPDEEDSKPAKTKAKSSPKKKADTSTSGGGGGAGFKSKEYISSSGSDSSSSEGSDKPLKKIAKKSKKPESPAKSEVESEKSAKGSDAESAKGSDAESEKAASEDEEKKEESGSAASSAKEDSGSE
ncbi:FACT complex subunit SSRP1-like [Physella acuta]|uniref:FACT complex subunit SSRP1-like n=1 Tax=Physella acuta TaxID=109671 RepID=UPI0027DC032E|nr:FACT complex subunit SSRP1-like [Physella acuta]